MPTHMSGIDRAALALFEVSAATDQGLPAGTLRVMERSAQPSTIYDYQLQDRALWGARFATPLLRVATRAAGSIVASIVENRYATVVEIGGEESSLFCFTMPLQGESALITRGAETIGAADRGFVFRPRPHTRLFFSDSNARSNIFLDATDVIGALENALDQHLCEPLEFRPALDWSKGLGSSLKGQLDFVTREFQRPDGVTGNPVALASTTDLLLELVLCGAPHNYTARMGRGPASAMPAYLRRAEAFMHSHCAEPLRMPQIAMAAGCSVRSLGVVFKSFRGTTPLQALHAIRLEQARIELMRDGPSARVATVARRYGFTNAGRFRAAFLRRFGEVPFEAAHRVR